MLTVGSMGALNNRSTRLCYVTLTQPRMKLEEWILSVLHLLLAVLQCCS